MSQNPDHQTAAHDIERHAFNAAFVELDLGWHWDEKTYAELQAISAESERVRRYVESRHRHLLTVYDADFLADAICSTKSRLTGKVSGQPS